MASSMNRNRLRMPACRQIIRDELTCRITFVLGILLYPFILT